jgi:general stress protein 26
MSNTDTVDTSKLWDMIKDIKFGMFTARHGNGHLHSRPMTTQNGSNDRGAVLWFFMSRKSDPVADLLAAPEVNVAYADTGSDSYVSVSGTARVVEDDAKKKALFNPIAKAWFPGGAADPDLALVAVVIAHAEYWDVKANQLVQLFEMAKAAVTGTPPTDMTEHGKVRMG